MINKCIKWAEDACMMPHSFKQLHHDKFLMPRCLHICRKIWVLEYEAVSFPAWIPQCKIVWNFLQSEEQYLQTIPFEFCQYPANKNQLYKHLENPVKIYAARNFKSCIICVNIILNASYACQLSFAEMCVQGDISQPTMQHGENTILIWYSLAFACLP